MTEHLATTYCRTLVDEWTRHGITDAVISPGSRSTPMALALAADDAIRVHLHHDERSAGFMALGLGIASGRPPLVLTTSGTAAVELHPAVVEAHQACVPMLVLTADRPPEMRDRWAPQTIDQRNLYGPAARWFCEPGPPEPEHRHMWRQLALDAVVATGGIRPGPVHLNLAFREPLLDPDADTVDLPPAADVMARVVPTWGLLDEQIARLVPVLAGARGLIVAGARTADDPGDAEAVLGFATRTGWPVVADVPSGCRTTHPHVVLHADAILRVGEVDDLLRPTVVLRFGGLLSSRVTNEWLARSGAAQLGFDRFGVIPDPDGALLDSFAVAPAVALRGLASALDARSERGWAPDAASLDPAYLEAWRRADAAAAVAVEATIVRPDSLTEPGVASALLASMPAASTLVASSSMPIRDLEWYVPARAEVRVVSNRGANGIDGVTSTAAGVALDGGRVVCLIGDVAFLHDTNGLLGLVDRGLDLLVVVVDNDGGGIFSFLPQAQFVGRERFEQLFGTPHGVDLAGLCAAHGLDVHVIDHPAALAAELTRWADEGGTRVVVVRSGRSANVQLHRDVNDAVAAAVLAEL